MNGDMSVGRYIMQVAVVDNVRNEKAVGTVNVVVRDIQEYGFQNQVWMILMFFFQITFFRELFVSCWIPTLSQTASPTHPHLSVK
jgi:hypothetical protein